MALKLSSDLVADVARAAAPDALRAATARLRNGASESIRDNFDAALRFAGAQTHAPKANLSGLREKLASANAVIDPAASRASAAIKGLETILNKVLVDGVMPRKSVVFGKGAAGDSWRMLLTDALAKSLAESARTGLGKGLVSSQPSTNRGGPPFAGKNMV